MYTPPRSAQQPPRMPDPAALASLFDDEDAVGLTPTRAVDIEQIKREAGVHKEVEPGSGGLGDVFGGGGVSSSRATAPPPKAEEALRDIAEEIPALRAPAVPSAGEL